jgi:hypothetical protein
MLIGIGCAALLVLGSGAALAAYFFVVEPAMELQEQAAAAASAAAGLGLSVSLSDGGVTVQVPASALSGLSASGGLAAGGPVCEQAAACCKSIAEKGGADPSAVAACENMKTLPLVGCTQALETYKRTAPIIGAKCP